MKTLIASIDSDIGAALHQQIPDADTTSRLGNGNYHLDVVKNHRLYSDQAYDRLFYTITADKTAAMGEIFDVNAIGTWNFLSFMADGYLKPGAQIIVLSSRIGSIAEVKDDRFPIYRMSKAALNMGVALLSKKFPAFNWSCHHPGLVVTKLSAENMNKFNGLAITPEESARLLIEVANKRLPFGFYNIEGRVIPW